VDGRSAQPYFLAECRVIHQLASHSNGTTKPCRQPLSMTNRNQVRNLDRGLKP